MERHAGGAAGSVWRRDRVLVALHGKPDPLPPGAIRIHDGAAWGRVVRPRSARPMAGPGPLCDCQAGGILRPRDLRRISTQRPYAEAPARERRGFPDPAVVEGKSRIRKIGPRGRLATLLSASPAHSFIGLLRSSRRWCRSTTRNHPLRIAGLPGAVYLIFSSFSTLP